MKVKITLTSVKLSGREATFPTEKVGRDQFRNTETQVA